MVYFVPLYKNEFSEVNLKLSKSNGWKEKEIELFLNEIIKFEN